MMGSWIFFALPQSGWKALSVQTGSMAPFIKPGALVLVHRIPATQLRVGDVITYVSTSTKKTNTHRIINIDSSHGVPLKITTRGDANSSSDQPILPKQVLGRVDRSIPVLGRLSDAARHPIGLGILIYLPALAVIISETRLLIKRLMELEPVSSQLHQAKSITKAIVTPPIMPVRANPHLSPYVLELRTITAEVVPHPPLQNPLSPKGNFYRTGLATIAVGLVLGVMVSLLSFRVARAFLESNQVSLISNSLTFTLTPPTPGVTSSVLLRQLTLRCSRDNTTTASTRPLIIIYNPTFRDINAGGWHLDDNAGKIITLPTDTRLAARRMYILTPLLDGAGQAGLQFAGDRLVIRDAADKLIDGISWGTDTTILSPPFQNVSAGSRIRRVPAGRDTNTLTDFWRYNRVCPRILSPDENQTADPNEPTVVGQFNLRETTTLVE